MDFEIKKHKELFSYLEKCLQTSFGFSEFEAVKSLKTLQEFLKEIDQSCVVGVESKYIDKLYRDEFYHYYSSKLQVYNRDCIRLSFFSEDFTIDDFHSQQGVNKLQKNFFGFLVLRPTYPKIIGRNALRPDVFTKKTKTFSCVVPISASINGIKFFVEAFPHSSQDGEFMVCAETMIWSTMEYFANRYPEYRPVLPKRIHSLLSNTSMQRQVPSTGLTGLQISYALKELGFGVKVYSSKSYGKDLFLEIIKIYIESGIPVITAISNDDGINHVINIIGRTEFSKSGAFQFKPIYTLQSGSVLYDYYDQEATYITIDDNFQPYIQIPLNNPAQNYVALSNAEWENCKIMAAIVPLHPRIYLEADRAKKLAIQALLLYDSLYRLPSSVFRVLLSSGRSFKHSISLNTDLNSVTKTLIVNLDMPKFVWIVEVGTVESFSQNKATGMILMDATEPKKMTILAYLLENTYIGEINGADDRYSLPLPPFEIFNNLKPF